METYIFIHSQDLLIKLESLGRYKNLTNLKYVMLGDSDFSAISHRDDVIIARDLYFNLESFPKLCAYSGWYALYANDIPKSDVINLFEYDIALSDDINEKIVDGILGNDYVAYSSMNIHSCFLENDLWSKDICRYVSGGKNAILNKAVERGIKTWMPVSNTTMTKDFFYRYMSDAMEFIYFVTPNIMAGHELERFLSVYMIMNDDVECGYISGAVSHYNMDSHNTQGGNRKESDLCR